MRHPPPISAVLFDLDGVLTDTAHAHYAAWKRLADELGVPFDEATNEALKGVDRMGSLDLLLRHGGLSVDQAGREALASRKNGWYLEAIQAYGPADLFPGAREALYAVRGAGLRSALCSASRNAPALIDRLGIADLFDVVVDPASVAHGKPAPDIFLAAARQLDMSPDRCLGVEDAPAGVAAIHAAGMFAIGIGDPQVLSDADRVIPSIADFRLEDYHAR
ncbi:MAG: beta-phosphoglucomutase [Sphingobium sp.]